MGITLDAGGGGGDEEPDLGLANDEVRSATAAIRHWETELAARVADAQALDTWWVVALTQLTGSREERVERAVAAVAEVQRKLEHARTVLAKAQEAQASAAGHHDAKLAGEAERLAALEDVALRVRQRGGPEAMELVQLELELEGLQARKEAIWNACSAASGVVAAANIVARRAASAKQHARGDAMGVPLAEFREWGDRLGLRKEQAEYVERAKRLQVVLREVGAAFETGGTLDGPSPWMRDVLLEQGGLWGDWAQAQRFQATQDSFESVASDARMLCEHLQREHLELKGRVEAVDDRREALLVRLSAG